MKKFNSLLLALALIISIIAPVSAAGTEIDITATTVSTEIDITATTVSIEIATAATTRAGTEAVRYNNTDPSVTYSGSWTHYEEEGFYAGDQRFTNVVGASAVFKFYGTSINYIGARSDNLGYCMVYLDDDNVGVLVDAYAGSRQLQQSLFYKDGLNPTEQHTIKIVVLGTGSPEAIGSYVTIDAFEVNGEEEPSIDSSELEKLIAYAKKLDGGYFTPETWSVLETALSSAENLLKSPVTQAQIDNMIPILQAAIDGLEIQSSGEQIYNDNDSRIKYEPAWTYWNNDPAFYESDEHFSKLAGASATLEFYGTGISYIGALSNNLGICEVYLDGDLVDTKDTYADELLAQQVLFEKDGLALGLHTIKIVVTGDKNAASTDYHATIDAFKVRVDANPTAPELYEPTRVAAGRYHSFGVHSNGDLYSWGYGSHYILGNGTQGDHTRPRAVLSGVKTAAGGFFHSLAVLENGDLYSWGANTWGSLGYGTFNGASRPVHIMRNVKSVSAFEYNSLAVTEDGGLYAWGRTDMAQVGTGVAQANTAYTKPQRILENVMDASNGRDHSVAVTYDGVLYGWGDNRVGQLGLGYTSSYVARPTIIADNVKYAAAGENRTAFITNDGDMYVMGWDKGSNPVKVLSNIESCAIGATHYMALTTDGTLYGWGGNMYGEIGSNSSKNSVDYPTFIMNDVKFVECGWRHTLAITESNQLYAWGDGSYNQVGDGVGLNAIRPKLIMASF